MELTKECLYSEIQKYIYDNKFSNLKVFSKQYYHSIVLPCYEDNSKVNPYSIISIDFNDMQKINEGGIKKGDKILYDSIKLMQSVLPNESYTVRIGGDEFLFVLPNVPKNKALQYETQIHEKLTEFSKKIKRATVSSYCVSSMDANNLSTLVEIANAGINAIKQTSKSTDNIDDWNILQNKVRENFSTFFKTLRFHNFPMTPDHLKNILMSVMYSYDSFMNAQANNVDDTLEENYNSDNINKKYSVDNVQSLNDFFINHRYIVSSHDELDKFDVDTFANLLNYLVRDSITMQFNKPYLINHLLGDKHQTLKALRVSSAFVKVSNTLNNSHSHTDNQIEKCGNSIYSFLNETIDFNQDAFADLPINYMVTLEGGDMLLVLNSDTNLNVEDIKDFLKINNSTSYSNDNLLRLVVADKFRIINNHNLEKVLSKQSEECNANKIPLIDGILNDDIITSLLDITMKDSMLFYKEHLSDLKDISAKSKYINLVSETILDLYSSLNVVHDDVKHKNAFYNFFNKVASVFKKAPFVLPEPTECDKKEQEKKFDNIAPFVSKFEIDYSKIRHSDESVKDNNRDQNSR